MSKISELESAIEEIRVVAHHLTTIADSMAAIFIQPAEEPTQPEKQKPLTLEQVRAVLADKSRDGHTEAIRNLLEKYGGSKLSEISPDRYAELLKDAEGLK